MQEKILQFQTIRDFNSVVVFKAKDTRETNKSVTRYSTSNLAALLRDNLTYDQMSNLVAELSIVTNNKCVQVTAYNDKAKYTPGVYVTCVRTGATYSGYVKWVMTYKPVEYIYIDGKTPELDERYQVVCCGPHDKYPGMLYGIVNEEGQFFVIGENGIELADE